jgi:hypothetical protein
LFTSSGPSDIEAPLFIGHATKELLHARVIAVIAGGTMDAFVQFRAGDAAARRVHSGTALRQCVGDTAPDAATRSRYNRHGAPEIGVRHQRMLRMNSCRARLNGSG